MMGLDGVEVLRGLHTQLRLHVPHCRNHHTSGTPHPGPLPNTADSLSPQQAFALSAQASNLPSSLRELARLSDEIWFLAGDSSVDSSWYTKRASLAAIYAASEVFMTQDTSPGFRDTERFLDERLEGLRRLGTGWRDVREWVGFQGVGALNVFRSKGFRV